MSKQTAKNAVTAFQFLTSPLSHSTETVCALVGEEAFLKHEVRQALLSKIRGQDDDDFALNTFEGKHVELRDVLDALSERSLFGTSQSVVVVEGADPFVKNYRTQLEEYVTSVNADSLLVLEVKTWPGNTRLAKAVSKSGLTIRCQVPQQGRELTEFTKQLKDWLVQVAQSQHQVELDRAAVDVLLELLPTEVGVLYQEVARLALLVEKGTPINVALIRENVGGWRTRKTWDMIDAAAEGRAADALLQLDRLIAAGDEPHALLPQMASTLRRFAAAVQIYAQAEQDRRKISLRTALERSGMPPL